MPTQAHTFISGFQTLPEAEQREVAAGILRLAAQWDSPSITDDELVRSADDLFAELDRREAADGN